jgi:hypothetical protein
MPRDRIQSPMSDRKKMGMQTGFQALVHCVLSGTNRNPVPIAIGWRNGLIELASLPEIAPDNRKSLNSKEPVAVTLKSRAFLISKRHLKIEQLGVATMTEHLRRAVPRQPADWFGFYRFDENDSKPWRCCRVIDISPLGVGLELFAISAAEDPSGSVTISVELHGETRNPLRGDLGDTARLGVEFSAPTEAARTYLRSINGVRSRW